MALSQPNRREISLKVVYYGPGLAGKATSLGYLHSALRADARGQMISVVTGGDRTMFFDFYPPPTPRLQGNALRMQLYTTPGEVRSESTHRGLLEGIDALVFVADSQRERAKDNLESMERLRQGLAEQGLSLPQVPHVFAWNKRDMDELSKVDELGQLLNRHQAPSFETVATAGRGVFDTLKAVTGLLVTDLTRRRGRHSNQPSSGSPHRRTPPGGVAVQEPRPQEVRGRIPEAIELGLLSQPTYLKPRPDDVVQVVAPRPLRVSPPPLTVTPPLPIPVTAASPASPPLGAVEVTETNGEAPRRRATPTWLQPLSPESTEAPASALRPLWLSQLMPPGPLREQLHAMEGDLSTGRFAQAVRRATAIFQGLTQGLSPMDAEEGQAFRALSLGISADRYRRFREAVRHAEVGTATLEDGLFTLFFLVDASLRRG